MIFPLGGPGLDIQIRGLLNKKKMFYRPILTVPASDGTYYLLGTYEEGMNNECTK